MEILYVVIIAWPRGVIFRAIFRPKQPPTAKPPQAEDPATPSPWSAASNCGSCCRPPCRSRTKLALRRSLTWRLHGAQPTD